MVMEQEEYENCESMEKEGVSYHLKKKNRLELMHLAVLIMILFCVCTYTNNMNKSYALLANILITICFVVKLIQVDNQFSSFYVQCYLEKEFFEKLVCLQPITYILISILVIFMVVINGFILVDIFNFKT